MPDYIPGDSQALIKAKLQTVDLPSTQIAVDAYFNPKELTIDKAVPWQKHKNTEGDKPTLEFTAAEPKMFSCEPMFDMFEDKGDVYATYIKDLHTMATVDDGLKRPPMVTFTWGTSLPTFQGVIESIQVKYTLFLPDGTPTRATVQLKMKQADSVKTKDEKKTDKAKAGQKKGTQPKAGDRTDTSANQCGCTPREYGEKNNLPDLRKNAPAGTPVH